MNVNTAGYYAKGVYDARLFLSVYLAHEVRPNVVVQGQEPTHGYGRKRYTGLGRLVTTKP